MRIKRLDIMGFKSFPERVQVQFSPGISAVVGPNGCGKSNIVDAIRWVMGEQSPRQLRGRQMEDVLFNGAKTHQPAGLAEVNLVLSNENGHGPGTSLGPSEISITRRLYRSGDSEYLINKVPCRLKDIAQFFMDTGMGTKAYAVIEQGRIGSLVDARPEERRALIDEAAGITRYKAQKKEAERKIEATEQNLLHIATMMSETKRQINSLTRAAGRAAKYKELLAQLKEVDVGLALNDLSALDARKQELAAGQAREETRLSGLLTDLERLELELEKTRLEIVDREKAAEAKSAVWYELQKEYASLQQEDQFNKSRLGESQNRQARLEADLERLTEQKRKLGQDLTRLKEESQVQKAEAEKKKEVLYELRAAYTELKREYDLAAGRQAELGRELSQTKSRITRLDENLAGQDRLARSLAARREEIEADLERIRQEFGLIDEQTATLLREKKALDQSAAEARDGVAGRREELTVRRSEANRAAAEERKADADLAALAARLATLKDLQAKFSWYSAGVRALMASPVMREAGVLGPVAERLAVPRGFEAAVEAALGERLGFLLVRDRRAAAKALTLLKDGNLGRCGFLVLDDLGAVGETDLLKSLLGDFTLADSLDQALSHPPSAAVLTKDGGYFGPNGLIIGGRASDHDQGLLARLREIELLTAQVQTLTGNRDRLASLSRELQDRIEEAQENLAQAEESARVVAAGLVDVDKQLSVLNGRRGEMDNRLASLNRALQEQEVQADKMAAEKEAALEEKQSLEADEYDLALEVEKAGETVAALAEQLEQANETGQQARLEANALDERLAAAEREVSQTEAWLKDVESQFAAKEEDLLAARVEETRMAERRQAVTGLLQDFQDKLVRAEEEAAVGKSLLDEARSGLNIQENEAKTVRRRREEINDLIHKIEMDMNEVGFKRQQLIKRLENDYRLNLESLAEEERPAADVTADLDQARGRRDDLKTRIEAMGEVNLTAIGEYDALMERYKFLKGQHDDLTEAVKNLRESITKINRTCKIRFSSTYQAVDQKLREIFPLLFDGGEAWLSLTDESDPLESGVEIHVHPPGKKLTVMSLLSGGEKALVALALIFALYLIKPSPFCLLDETDAPLDEANIDRFNRLLTKLGQSSQIIMVTHNKRTMQISQTLYGVTMEVPGISKMVTVSLAELQRQETSAENAQMVQAG
ncbi:MAG: chromosome segregation protein SMC [Thermodesulfobacteriota bacterium]